MSNRTIIPFRKHRDILFYIKIRIFFPNDILFSLTFEGEAEFFII